MQALADAVWRAFGSDEPDANDTIHVSWVGFYFGPGAAFRVESSAADAADLRTPGDNEMLLGPSRNKPACSPIGLHGACGRAFRERRTLVVRDVADLGEHYVACDPRDRSELVIPCFTEAGEPYAVLDLDSFAVNGFTDHDAEQLKRLLHALQLTH
jgi:putative methionine-R-sulfoxide reductase with GAF domain